MGRRQEEFSKEEVRRRVNQVMDRWRSYPGYAQLLDALLQANGISARRFVQQYTQTTGRALSSVAVDSMRSGDTRPTYQFVADIADHVLLSLDPERMRPAGDSLPAGDHRIALFTAAGLIEVTPNSIRQWNQEVLAGWQHGGGRRLAGAPLTWKELMKKLLDFHLQGGRCGTDRLAEAANRLVGTACQLDRSRFHHLLSGLAVPTSAERLGLAKAAELDSSQIQLIEAAVENGTLPLAPRSTLSVFSGLLDEILDRLRVHGISQRQLVFRTIPPGAAEPELSQSGLSAWKNGKTRPTKAALRAFVGALERCPDQANRPLVPQEELRQLVSAAGFSLEELAATTHDIVAHIDETTRIKPLLAALRNAADLNVPMSAVDSPEAQSGVNTAGVSLLRRLEQWENEGSANQPTQSEARDLLARYNRLLRAKGQEELNAEEMQKIAEVAQRDREDGLRHGLRNRAQDHRPPSARRIISPDFDSGPSTG